MKPFHFFLIAIFVLAWILAAIHPTTPQNWLQENIMVFIWLPIIIGLGHYIKLSKISYTIITIFLILHLVGAHYNYGAVPFGKMLGEWLGYDRNLYDRFMHFSFGLMMVIPVRELFLRISSIKGFWGYFIPINIMLSFSAIYEMFEWFSVLRLPPETGFLFIGGTDNWDPIKDMAVAGIGALLSIFILASIHAFRDPQFWTKFKSSFKKNKNITHMSV